MNNGYVKIQDAWCSCCYYKVLHGRYIDNGFVYDTCNQKHVQENKKLTPAEKCCDAVIQRGECNFTTDMVKCPMSQWEK